MINMLIRPVYSVIREEDESPPDICLKSEFGEQETLL